MPRIKGEMRRLSELHVGEEGQVARLAAPGRAKRRLFALGLRPGARIKLLRRAPLGDPLEVQVGESFIALRRREAEHILVDR